MFSEKLPEKLRPYSGIIYFVVVLTCAHFFWKFTVRGDETDTLVTFLGIDISAPFNSMALHVTKFTKFLIEAFGVNIYLLENNLLRYDNDVAVRIVWSCTGIKQAFIFTCIIVFYKGNLKQKLWFIPLGLLIVYLTNIARISLIVAIIRNHPNWFYLLHEHIFKYLFYMIIFGLWVIWDEKIKSKV